MGHLKANHFHLGHDKPHQTGDHFRTLHQNYFKQPGNNNSGIEASRFASEKKQELMKNHFDFGGPTLLKNAQALQSSSKAYFNSPILSPTGAKAPEVFNTAGSLKHKSVNVMNGGPTAHPGAGFFASNTATSFKWIQPQFVN